MAERVYLTIPAKPRYLSLARLSVSGICVGEDIDMDTLGDIRLLLTESCNLSFSIGLKDTIDIVMEPEEGAIRFFVSGITREKVEADERLAITAMIIESLADDFSYDDGQLVVYKTFGA
ncbi:MAG: hypothetical protein SOW18_02025 [Peptoniphilus sp.]|nr:hypothetical protein [Peptoniphilus sp.]MDY3118296.1 hypothetical protein [Peptoniphilus sp.]